MNTLENFNNQSSESQRRVSATPVKRSKWHLGIRSQSRPHDIMGEVFRAMKALNFEWKVVNPFYVRVRRTNPLTGAQIKLGLQLYQVDSKSYLLDFKSLTNPRDSGMTNFGSDDRMEVEEPMSPRSPTTPTLPQSPGSPRCMQHCTMEFFEMCASLIATLAR
eukprot:XP_797954.1 PREDICTED: 5'-AMP-activated protein kinase catalytic subunit alpha-2 [Strongylocentrotus purpuratus]